MQIDYSQMSIRLTNVLMRNEFTTYEEICALPSWQIIHLRNFGKRSYNELLMHLKNIPEYENSRLYNTVGLTGNAIEKRVEILKKWIKSGHKAQLNLINKINRYDMELKTLENEIGE